MKKILSLMAFAATTILTICSCSSTRSGAGGYDTGMGVDAIARSYNSYDLVPVGDRITYTIDISTPEGQQKLYKLKLHEAQRLAETEASRKYNCDRLIDPRFNYLKKASASCASPLTVAQVITKREITKTILVQDKK